MRIFIVRHLDESFFSAGITPQGFYDQHSPLTLFRKVEVLTIIYSIALQRQVFVIHFRGGSVLSPAMVAMCSSGSNPRWEWKFTPKSCPYTNFFSSIQSRQLFIPIGCFCWVLGRHWNWEPGAFSIARQTQELNGAVTGRWCSTVTVRATLFYLKQIDCLSVHFSSYFKKLILP